MAGKLRIMSYIALMALVVSFSAGCSKGSSSPESSGAKPESIENSTKPITLKIYNWGNLTDEEYQKLFVGPIKAKYPNITLELIKRATDMKESDLAVGGNQVDLFIIQGAQLLQFNSYKLLTDMGPLIKKNKVNLDRFKPEDLETVRAESGGDDYLALPFQESQLWALVYNKDIFDKFGVSYPKDGMTWDDTVELAKKLTRVDGSTQYNGLDFQTVQVLGEPLQLKAVDGKTDKASVNTPGWVKVFSLAKKISDIPGNDLPTVTAAKTRARFLKDRNVAMFGSPALLSFVKETKDAKDLNWDIAQYPSYPEKPNTFGIINLGIVLGIGSTSQYKDEAMKIVDLVTSEEDQLIYAKGGGFSPLKSPEIQKQFGTEVPELKGKHLEGAYKSKPAPFVLSSQYNDIGNNVLKTKLEEIKQGKDINTALREAEEEINSKIQAELGPSEK